MTRINEYINDFTNLNPPTINSGQLVRDLEVQLIDILNHPTKYKAAPANFDPYLPSKTKLRKAKKANKLKRDRLNKKSINKLIDYTNNDFKVNTHARASY